MKSLYLFAALLCAMPLVSFGQMSLSSQAIDWLQTEVSTHRNVRFKKPQPLYVPGKIYTRGDVLYVNDKGSGLHVYDNTNPALPRQVRFIDIPGNIDIAMKDNMLYADSYHDLLAIDLSTNKTTRIRDVFAKAMASDKKNAQARVNSAVQQGSAAAGGNGVKAGSMARFAIVKNYLYVLDERKIKIFNLSQPSKPQKVNEVDTRFVVETVYPVDDLLFVAGMEGVYIFNVYNPVEPIQQSIFTHALGCDPVVVQGEFAYITLRAGTNCNPNGTSSRLDIVNIANPKKTQLVSSFVMSEPRGLDVDKDFVYLCNKNALEIYKFSPDRLTYSLVKKHDIPQAYDVMYIADKHLIIAVGEKGIYQFRHENDKIQLLGTLDKQPLPAGGNKPNSNNPLPFKLPANIDLGNINLGNLGSSIGIGR